MTIKAIFLTLWACQDSNLEPIGYEPTALPLSYRPSPAPLRAADGIRTRDKSLEGYCVTPTPLPQTSRGGRIRTDDLSDPNRALYQAEPRPVTNGKYSRPPGASQLSPAGRG